MTWEIFVGITVLAGFLISIGKIIKNNTQAMTEMKCSIDNLNFKFTDQKEDIQQIKTQVFDINVRVSNLEKK